MQITAAVARTTGAPFTVESLELEAPRDGELLVRIIATGLCHTDVVVRDGVLPTPLPAVLGHEGAGIVEGVGAQVQGFAVGDHVVIGFAACRACRSCTDGEPAYCEHFFTLNFSGARPDGSHPIRSAEGPMSSAFFGQSSFATHALVAAHNAVKVPAEAPLALLGPLGCGIMTGAGAILNALAVAPGHAVLVSGGGPVGLSAVMAAAVAGATTIILSDPLPERRRLALELGATHVIDPLAEPVPEQVRGIVARGADRVLDSSGVVPAIEAALAALAPRGRVAMVGVPKSLDASVAVPILPMLSAGSTLCGVTEGDADPQQFIPYLLQLHAEGRFPFDRLMTLYPLARINEAVADQAAGRCVKAVLTM